MIKDTLPSSLILFQSAGIKKHAGGHRNGIKTGIYQRYVKNLQTSPCAVSSARPHAAAHVQNAGNILRKIHEYF